jgi:hypothetical protein
MGNIKCTVVLPDVIIIGDIICKVSVVYFVSECQISQPRMYVLVGQAVVERRKSFV